jgi:hypothetical protein
MIRLVSRSLKAAGSVSGGLAGRWRTALGLLGLGLVAASAGCGYSLGYRPPPSVGTVAVPIFDNETFPLWREVEYELTEAFRREIQARTGLRLSTAESADMVIRGRITEFRPLVIAEGNADKKTESVLLVAASLVVEDMVNRRRSEVEVRVREPFSDELGETVETARAQAIKDLSEKMLLAIEWWEEP